MSLRRFAPVPLLALAFAACTPSVQSTQEQSVVTAAFDPTKEVIPLPNDLALLAAPSTTATNAEFEVLQYFVAQGGFSYDQEIDITIPFVTVGVGTTSTAVPAIDVKSIKPCTAPSTSVTSECNLLVLDATTGEYPTIDAPTYAAGSGSGTLTVVKSLDPATQNRLWTAGHQYFYAVRGEAKGIKTTDGASVYPSATTYALLFSAPSALPGCGTTPPSASCVQAQQLQAQYQPVFAAVTNKGFSQNEIAVVGTFQVAPGHTWVQADATAATLQIPLPSDFLLDPTTGKVSAAAAAAFGPLGPGIATLDGFSTTAIAVAPTSGPIKGATVHAPGSPAGLYVYELTKTGPQQVYDVVDALTAGKSPTFVSQPPPVISPSGTSGLVAFQPAVPAPTPVGTLALPPLKERTEYAVVITHAIVDAAGNPLSNTTLGQFLLFRNPLCSPSPQCAANPADSASTIPGVPGAQASGLEAMRLALQPVTAKLKADHGVATSDIAMIYTFRTQTITEPALELAAAPYAQTPTTPPQDVFPPAPIPAATVALTPAQAAAKYGVPDALVAGVGHFVDTEIVTFDKLDPGSGAFYPATTAGTATPIPALLAFPATSAPQGGYPLVVFHHGLSGGRAQMLAIASALTQGGFAVAAIDAPKHGDRSWCTVDAQCATGSTCNHAVFGNQGDPANDLPGLCTAGLAYKPVTPGLPACSATVTTDCWNGTGGIAVASGNYIISANFFRTRDSLRQDILDESMLVRVLTTAQGQAVIQAALNPGEVYFVGQSLGSIEGTLDVAANPRFSRTALNVGGGTIVDIFTTSPAFAPGLGQLLGGLGIEPGTAAYLEFLLAAKWVLDPADPVNFAGHLVTAPLPNLLANPNGSVPQAPKVVLGQAARCDNVVPNATNEELYGNVPLAPIDPVGGSASPTVQWYMASTSGACPTDGTTGPGATHGFLLDFANPSLTTKAQTNVVEFFLGAPVAATPVTP